MSNYSNTKATIAANVYTNHNNEVTAEMVKAGINAVVDSLIAGGYLFKGVAIPSTNPGTPDANVCYKATTPGTYTNFGGLVVNDGESVVLLYNGSWTKQVTGDATAAEVTALGQEVGKVLVDTFGKFPLPGTYLNVAASSIASVYKIDVSKAQLLYVYTYASSDDKVVLALWDSSFTLLSTKTKGECDIDANGCVNGVFDVSAAHYATIGVFSGYGSRSDYYYSMNDPTLSLDKKANINPGANLFNKNAHGVLSGIYIDNNNARGASASYNASDFIPVKASTAYYCAKEDTNGFRFATFYDANLQYISGVSSARTFTTPATTAYVRVTFYAASYSYAQVSEHDTNYVAYAELGGYLERIEPAVELTSGMVVKSGSLNLLNPDDPDVGLGKYMNGSAIYNGDDYDVTGYMPVEVGQTYALFPGVDISNTSRNKYFRFVSFFKADKTYLSNVANVDSFTPPANAAFAVATVYNRDYGGDRQRYPQDLAISDVRYATEYTAYNFIHFPELKEGAGWTPNSVLGRSNVIALLDPYIKRDVLYGKKWVACGDSFTKGGPSVFTDQPYLGQTKSYPIYIGRRTGMNVINEAVHGSTMCYIDGTHNEFSAANGRYTQIPADADYITLYFGINDVNYSSPLGDIDDEVNTTFYGAWNIVLRYLITNHPFAKIGIIITNGASNAIMEAERAVARKWGIPFLDYADEQTPLMNRMSGFRTGVTAEAFTLRQNAFIVGGSDTHPNPQAHEYESTFIEAFLRRL